MYIYELSLKKENVYMNLLQLFYVHKTYFSSKSMKDFTDLEF
jgi:hypothetical protein